MNALYWIWLQDALGCGNPVVNPIMENNIPPTSFYEKTENELKSFGFFNKKQIEKLKSTKLDHAKKVFERCQEKNYTIITPDDKAYPNRFRNIYSPPLVFYAEGNFRNLDDIPTIGMVGTRHMTSYGKRVANEFACELSCAGFVVVSGFALGIDTESHKGVLRAHGESVAILGCGLDKNHPIENWEIRNEITKRGAVISEYQPDTPAGTVNFHVRNRLIAGLSLGILVVEGKSRSGALITAGCALSQGKDVFAVPSTIYEPNGEAPLRLIKEGAKIVTCIEDIVEEYRYRFEESISEISVPQNSTNKRKADILPQEDSIPIVLAIPTAPDYLDENQKLVFNLLSTKPKIFYDILPQSNLKTNQLLSILTELEIYGLIKAYPGKWFSL